MGQFQTKSYKKQYNAIKQIESKCDNELINAIKFRLLCDQDSLESICEDICCICYGSDNLTRPVKFNTKHAPSKELFSCQHVICAMCNVRLRKMQCPQCMISIDVLPYHKKFCVIVPMEITANGRNRHKAILVASKIGILYYPHIALNKNKVRKYEIINDVPFDDSLGQIVVCFYWQQLFEELVSQNFIIIYYTHEVLINTFDSIGFSHSIPIIRL
jgi:hypothetical protein